MRKLPVCKLFKVGVDHVFVHFEHICCLQGRVSKRLEFKNGLLSELLGDTIGDIWRVLASIANFERIGVQDSDAVNRLVDAVRSAPIALCLTLLQLHAFDVFEGDLVAVLKVELLVAEEFNNALLGAADRTHDDVLELLSVLVEDFEIVAKVVEDATEDTRELRVDKLLALGSAIVIDCNCGGVVSLRQNNHVHILEVPWFGLELSLEVRDGCSRGNLASHIVVKLLEARHALLSASLALDNLI
mmetsp:Transcript_13065/g.17627  ORF Transcript_13065/g.17627 Transcript_13065/m.17627 type:complete len:244 (-) Transcript_13065:1563-2294(-)